MYVSIIQCSLSLTICSSGHTALHWSRAFADYKCFVSGELTRHFTTDSSTLMLFYQCQVSSHLMMGSMLPGRYLVSCIFSNPQICDEVGDDEYFVSTPEKRVQILCRVDVRTRAQVQWQLMIASLAGGLSYMIIIENLTGVELNMSQCSSILKLNQINVAQ